MGRVLLTMRTLQAEYSATEARAASAALYNNLVQHPALPET